MTSKRAEQRVTHLALAALLLLPALAAQAAVYPTNACVSSKQKAAGIYCSQVLKAWAKWDVNPDDDRRDDAIAQAAAKLGAAWTKAEEKAAGKGADCAETTASDAALRLPVDSAIGAIVNEVNDGLDREEKDHTKCGQKLLQAAGRACSKLLKAESVYVRQLAKDPEETTRNDARAAALAKFGEAWTKATAGNCPTTGSESDVADRLEALRDAVVRDTTVSPNVDDTQFTTLSPTGTTAYEGRELRPTCMDSSPYHFFVKRGSVNKLLMYYQGGGACWEQLTCSFPACDTNVDPNGGDNPNNLNTGFADRDNPANPFRDWNIVFVSYCSCDVHFGDAAQDYPLHVEHRGYHNAKIAEKWAREHFVNPEVVFVTGSSAGAYGAQFNAPLLHLVWPASRFHMLADAGNGVITAEFLETYFPNWNFEANIPFEQVPGLREVFDGGAGIPGYIKLMADFLPKTNWAHYSTAFDGGTGGQASFYNIMINGNNPAFGLLWWNGCCPFNAQMRAQALDIAAAAPANYRYYIGTGSRHTMWGSNKVYSDTTGGVPTIVDWINAMLNSPPGAPDPGWTNVECTNCGLTLAGDPVPDPIVAPFEQVGPDVVIDCAP
jgi:hypothetical protein